METNWRAILITAFAPIAWASTYAVTRTWLPADAPLTGAVLRALPAGLLLLAIGRARPHGSWWWKALVMGSLNTGGFFALVYAAAQLLPTSVATVLTAIAPGFILLAAFLVLAERPRMLAILGAALGVAGVVLLVGASVGGVHPIGVAAALLAVTMNAFGSVLAKRWSQDGVGLVSSTSWQLIGGGLVVLPFAILVEGVPPIPTPAQLGAYAYLAVVGTALAFLAWFSGLRSLPAQQVGLIGLLNPVAGILIGVAIAGELLTWVQWVGIGVVLGAVVLGQIRLRPRARARLGGGPARAVQLQASAPMTDSSWRRS